MFDGRIVGEVPQAEATERKLGLMMAGVPPEDADHTNPAAAVPGRGTQRA
jgi:hypothetical protein